MHAVGKDLPFYRFSPPTAAIEPDDSFQSRRLCWAFLFHVHHPSTHTHTHVSPLSFYKLFFFLYEHDQEKWLTTMIRKFSGSLDHLSFFVLRPHNIFPTQMGTLVICHVSIFRPNGSSSLSFCSCMSMTKKVQICCRCASGTKGNPLHDRIIPLILLHTDNSSPVLLLT